MAPDPPFLWDFGGHAGNVLPVASWKKKNEFHPYNMQKPCAWDGPTQWWSRGFCPESLRLMICNIAVLKEEPSLQNRRKTPPEMNNSLVCSFELIHEKDILVQRNSHGYFNGILTHRRVQGLSPSHFTVLSETGRKGQTHHVAQVLSL